MHPPRRTLRLERRQAFTIPRETSHSMSRSIIGVAARWSRGPSRWIAAGVASATAAAVGLSVVAGGGAGTAFAGVDAHAVSSPVVTRAAIDPSLVTGRGA